MLVTNDKVLRHIPDMWEIGFEYLRSLLVEHDFHLDRRLVETSLGLVLVLITHRHRIHGVKQSLDAISRIERPGQLRTAYRERLSRERAAARLLQTLDVLFKRPILNIRRLEAALDVPYRTAQMRLSTCSYLMDDRQLRLKSR